MYLYSLKNCYINLESNLKISIFFDEPLYIFEKITSKFIIIILSRRFNPKNSFLKIAQIAQKSHNIKNVTLFSLHIKYFLKFNSLQNACL